MRKWNISLLILLVLSLSGNAYLFYLVVNWQDAWLAQIITTSDVERLYRESSADTSIRGVMVLAASEGIEIKQVPYQESDKLWLKGEKKVLVMHDTRLFFINDKYVGSRASVPAGLSHWGLGQE